VVVHGGVQDGEGLQADGHPRLLLEVDGHDAVEVLQPLGVDGVDPPRPEVQETEDGLVLRCSKE
jgi:hypothetical protein